jgi:uncharacterized repeat protein (TIGR02543 family)
VKGDNTDAPVTVNCGQVNVGRIILNLPIQISVSTGYTITSVQFSVYSAYDNAYDINVSRGTISNKRPNAGTTVTVSGVNNSTTELSTYGTYTINQIQVTYTANTYSVSYNANGGTGTTASQTKTHGVTLQLRNNGYSRTGYTFSKWNTQANGKGTNYNAGANYTANAAATMYAQWTVNTYKVKFNGNGNTGGSMSDQNFTYGTAQNLTANGFSKTGYTFAGWATSASGAKVYNNQQSVNNLTTTNGGTVNLYAKWTANTYKVKFNGNGSTSGSMSDQNFTYGTAQNLTANGFSRTGYTFAGWATSAGGDKVYNNQQSVNNLTATNGGTFNLYAKWDVVNYAISYELNGGTADNPTNYNIETATFTLNNPTRDGYTFTGWTGSNGSTPQTEVSIAKGSTGDKSYTANWISQAAANVMGLISAIGEVAYTAESKAKIDAARDAYNALTDEQKAEVTNYATLTAAETAYAEAKTAADHAAADAVIAKINAIGEVAYTDECKDKIDAARAAYDNLTDDQKLLISAEQLAVLTAAEDAYATLVADHAAADAVIAKINAIGTVEYTEASAAKIDAARIAYDALTDDQKALISAEQLAVLTAAEDAYAALVADHAAADAVIAKINAIGTVEYTEASAAKIDAAREAYNALTDDQKLLISDEQLAVLTAAEDAYATLVADHAAADAVVELINAIGTVTADSKDAIDAARAAYDALTDDQKALVDADALDTLEAAEDAYSHLVPTALDNAAVDTKATKRIVNGQLLILRGDKVYTVDGRLAR